MYETAERQAATERYPLSKRRSGAPSPPAAMLFKSAPEIVPCAEMGSS
jgi:hypothetical protein